MPDQRTQSTTVNGVVAAAETHLITDLGNLRGETAGAAAINNNNQVAGTSTLTNPLSTHRLRASHSPTSSHQQKQEK